MQKHGSGPPAYSLAAAAIVVLVLLLFLWQPWAPHPSRTAAQQPRGTLGR